MAEQTNININLTGLGDVECNLKRLDETIRNLLMKASELATKLNELDVQVEAVNTQVLKVATETQTLLDQLVDVTLPPEVQAQVDTLAASVNTLAASVQAADDKVADPAPEPAPEPAPTEETPV